MRVGVIGAGTMGQVHLRAWRALGAEVHLYDRNELRVTELAAGNSCSVHPSIEALLAQVQVVDVCLPTFMHREVVEQAARAGCHVVCEKPLALSLEDGQAMLSACEHAGVRLFVAMVVRFFPQYRSAWELVRNGDIGQPIVTRLKRVSYPPHGGSSWYADEVLSGGMLLDLMLHDIDYALWVSGDVRKVYARLNQVGSKQYAQAILSHTNGATTLIEGGWAYPEGLFRTALDISGTRGLIEWSSDAPPPVRKFLSATTSDVQGVALPGASLGDDPYTAQLRHFKAALELGTPFDVTPAEALRALQVALAARQSTRTGLAVPLEGSA